MQSDSGPAPGEWVQRLTCVLVCGVSCGALMNYYTQDAQAFYGCAAGCTRNSPVLAADVVTALLQITGQLQSLVGLSSEQRLHRLPDLISKAKVGTHGRAISVTWAQQRPRRPPATAAPPQRPASVTRRWQEADLVLSDPPGIVYRGTPRQKPQHRSI